MSNNKYYIGELLSESENSTEALDPNYTRTDAHTNYIQTHTHTCTYKHTHTRALTLLIKLYLKVMWLFIMEVETLNMFVLEKGLKDQRVKRSKWLKD